MEINSNENNSHTNTTLVCNKGDILLESYKNINDTKKAYYLSHKFVNINSSKINIISLIDNKIYELLEKTNVELIEKIIIMNKINEDIIDVCIFLNNIAKEFGLKQKYILFRSIRYIDYKTCSVKFNLKDIMLVDNNLCNQYLNRLNINTNKYDNLFFEYGNIMCKFENITNEIFVDILNNNIDLHININFIFDFKLLLTDYLPIHMENLLGLIMKKIFYNSIQFIYSLNKL
tara:strand:+ start:395 stop:1090 length:696 start_codon:yes stop_codon:yes gene_type:complete